VKPQDACPVLVTGASGRLGRLILDELLRLGCTQVIAASRSMAKLSDYAAHGVELRYADFAEPASLRAAFAGVQRLVMISSASESKGVRRLQQHINAIDAAVCAGVQHIVYTSTTGPRPTDPLTLFDDHFWTEHALGASSIGWSILRHNIYADQLLDSLPSAIAFGRSTSLAPDAAISYITRADCARVDVAALLDGFQGRRLLEITGPCAVSRQVLANYVGELCDTTVCNAHISEQKLRAALRQIGMWPHVIESQIAFETGIAEGRHALVTSAAATLIGRAPQSVEAFLATHRAALVSSAAKLLERVKMSAASR